MILGPACGIGGLEEVAKLYGFENAPDFFEGLLNVHLEQINLHRVEHGHDVAPPGSLLIIETRGQFHDFKLYSPKNLSDRAGAGLPKGTVQ